MDNKNVVILAGTRILAISIGVVMALILSCVVRHSDSTLFYYSTPVILLVFCTSSKLRLY